MNLKKVIFTFTIISIISALVACASSPMTTQNNKVLSIQQLEGAPLPSGAVIDSKKSIIFGEGALWTGLVEIETNLKHEDVVKFFISEYTSAGWTILSSTKSQSSTLIFVGKNKTLTVEIHESSRLSFGTRITMTVAPMNK